MPEEISKDEFLEREKAAWNDVVKRLDFLVEIVCAKTERTIIRDASTKLMAALSKHKPLMAQRMQVEFTTISGK